jgi:hypothetical protein
MRLGKLIKMRDTMKMKKKKKKIWEKSECEMPLLRNQPVGILSWSTSVYLSAFMHMVCSKTPVLPLFCNNHLYFNNKFWEEFILSFKCFSLCGEALRTYKLIIIHLSNQFLTYIIHCHTQCRPSYTMTSCVKFQNCYDISDMNRKKEDVRTSWQWG